MEKLAGVFDRRLSVSDSSCKILDTRLGISNSFIHKYILFLGAGFETELVN